MFLSVFTACTKEKGIPLSNELSEIIVFADNFIPETNSRAFSFVNNEVAFSWSNGDTIGIFPNEGAQAYFPILVGSEESNSASFNGGGWALKASSTYAAYYPFIGDFYMSQKKIPVSYVGQKQNGNASMAHLSVFDYMFASASTPNSGRVNFKFKHLGAFVQLKIIMPQGGTLSSVTLSSDEAVFVTEGIIDLTSPSPAIQTKTKSKTLTLDVEGVTTTVENPIATLYMMLAPVDMTDKILSAVVKQSDGSSETITLTSKNFEKGKAYGINGTMKDLNDDETIGTGTYKDGVVSVAEPGTMKSLLGDNYLNITSLKVVGAINGDDVYCLREMLGARDFNNNSWRKLAVLDLSEASIVEGGGWYSQGCYTSNKTVGDNMFANCTKLETLILPNNITSIGKYAFSGSDFLNSIAIPNGVTSVGEAAFMNCSALTSINIPNDVTLIPNSLFWGCCALTSVAMSENVKQIGSNAFYNCDAITSIRIPDGVTLIGMDAFNGCNVLSIVTIGKEVASIGYSAFEGCI